MPLRGDCLPAACHPELLAALCAGAVNRVISRKDLRPARPSPRWPWAPARTRGSGGMPCRSSCRYCSSCRSHCLRCGSAAPICVAARFRAAAAGQIVVHLALTVVASCSSHPVAGAQEPGQPTLDVVMTAAHVGALIVMMTAAARPKGWVLTRIYRRIVLRSELSRGRGAHAAQRSSVSR